MLKDILLVVASMVIFGDPVTGQHFVGYSIALSGLVYYKLGAEKIQSLSMDTKLWLREVRRTHPAGVKIAVGGGIILSVIFIRLVEEYGLRQLEHAACLRGG